MPSTNGHNRNRRILMTVVMWGVLAGTVALAAWASRHPNRPPKAQLELPEQFEQVLRDHFRRITTQPG